MGSFPQFQYLIFNNDAPKIYIVLSELSNLDVIFSNKVKWQRWWIDEWRKLKICQFKKAIIKQVRDKNVEANWRQEIITKVIMRSAKSPTHITQYNTQCDILPNAWITKTVARENTQTQNAQAQNTQAQNS